MGAMRNRESAAAIRTAVFALVLGACASAPRPSAPVVVAPPVPELSADRKVSLILRLEQQRTLRDPGVEPALVQTGVHPARTADLEELIRDTDPAIRRRAALAIGRIGDARGGPSLVASLGDPDAEVRASAAFALGLLGDKSAAPTLSGSLKDESLQVRIRAIEALGLLGDPASAAGIAEAASGCDSRLAALEPDDEEFPKAPEIELCRSSLFALVRTGSYEGIAGIALDSMGRPVSRWWPLAFALQRSADRRASSALQALASGPGVYTPSFALRGLASLKEPAVVSIAAGITGRRDIDIKLRVAAVRALGQVGGAEAVPPLVSVLGESGVSPNLTIEVIAALGALRQATAFEPLVDLMTDGVPAVRAAALAAAAKVDPEAFLIVLAGIGRDRDWSVRAALGPILGSLPIDRVRAVLEDLAVDEDPRVHGPALEGFVAAKAPGVGARLLAALQAPDFGERATAAQLLGDLKPVDGASALAAAYARGESDAAFEARGAALEALAKYGGEEAVAVLRRALADRDWPIRWRAADLLRGLGLSADPTVPAPIRQPAEYFESAALLHPTFSPHAFIETRYGTVEVELNLVEAPVVSQSFIDLARAGYFNGVPVHRVVPGFVIQDGDPRGDGEGGPGYTIRDELSPLPYLRGTMGLALNWRDTGGSQWFITLSPQPHLDGKYTAFGHVVNGWDALDRIAVGDVIERVRIWDGVELK